MKTGKKKKNTIVLAEVPCPICNTNMDIVTFEKHSSQSWATYKCPKCKFVYNEE